MSSTHTRRAALTGIATAALVPTIGLAGAPPDDPIFAAIALHKDLFGQWYELCNQGFDDDSPEDERAEMLSEDVDAALLAMLTTAPTTIEGAIAALEYAAADEGGQGTDNTNLSTTFEAREELFDAGINFPQLIADALRQINGVALAA